MGSRDQREFTDPSDSRKLFARIARHYDAINRLLSLGRDRHWRRVAAEALALPAGGHALDVGIGTGDMALAVMERWSDAVVTGVDPTTPMMNIGRQKVDGERLAWAQADGLRLPFPDEHFDGVVSAFVLRNVIDVPRTLAEQSRVVRDGGRVVCLEMSWPRTPLFKTLFRLYFADVMPRVAGVLSGQPAAYRYLPRSVQGFLTPGELTRTMEEAGLRSLRCQRLAFGTVTLHVAARSSSREGSLR